jgi:hypothetical protein
MNRFAIYLISKNSQWQHLFYDWAREKVILDKLVIIERDDSLFETIFKLKTTSSLYIYDSDFSCNMSSTSFIRKASSIFPESKIIIMGNDVIEARTLINNQLCPFGYINKKDNWGKIEETLLFLIFTEHKERKAESIKEI